MICEAGHDMMPWRCWLAFAFVVVEAAATNWRMCMRLGRYQMAHFAPFNTTQARPVKVLCGLRFVCAVAELPFGAGEAIASGQEYGYRPTCSGAALTVDYSNMNSNLGGNEITSS